MALPPFNKASPEGSSVTNISVKSSAIDSQRITTSSQQPIQFDRLSLEPIPRIALATVLATSCGFLLGFAKGSKVEGLQFRAENAHRLPNTQQNWYLYHKSKNYHVLRAGVSEGLRMGSKLGVWVWLFFVVENGVDRCRNVYGIRNSRKELRTVDEDVNVMLTSQMQSKEATRDFLSTTAAGLGVAGAYSIWSKLPINAAGSLIRLGLIFGTAFGLVQDGANALKGHRVNWIETVKHLADTER